MLGKRREINYNAKIDYSILNNLVVTATYAQQFRNNIFGEYYPRTSLFRGFNRSGLARRAVDDNDFSLFETYGTYTTDFSGINLSATAGYSFQQTSFESFFVQAGNFPNDILGFNALEFSRDLTRGGLLTIGSDASPNERIIAQFARVNLSFDGGIFLNASVRREGSTKLGVDNQWGIFPAVGVGVDLNRYLNLATFDQLKFRAGYGVTGSLPRDNGLSQDRYSFGYARGGANSEFERIGNPNLKWEQKQELNVGFDMSSANGKLNGSLDVYTRNIKDFVLELDVDAAVFGAPRQFQNAGALRTNGIEAALGYVFDMGDLSWSPGIVLSSYKTILKDFVIDEQMRANLGAPGQNGTNIIRTKVGEEIGQIWGPRFSGSVDENGVPIMVDLNGDEQLITNQGSALLPEGDFEVLGKGIPSLEIGWTNQLTYRNWDLNVFFRGAFGHSLVNSFRAFYEPRIPGQINSYNASNTSLARDDIQSAQFSSYYVERADFLRLDNATLGYNFVTPQGSAFNTIRIYTSVQNAFVITGYNGLDPDPVLQDFGSIDNGGRPN
ncbi:MAG: TonB-dependent receptor, partial [Bacteroidota bacterium]|nr:TonB-dependent receptor [Bacteroidota bacterium]